MYIPSPTAINSLLVFSAFLGCVVVVYRESKPETRMGYSKFAPQDESTLKIPSRVGMLMIYSPSVILSLLTIVLLPARHHSNWVAFMCFLHYFKRVYEVLRIHKYSGHASARDACLISIVYITLTSIFIYLATQVPFSVIDKRQVRYGTMLFFIGESVNYYHHHILSNLRKSSGDSAYKIPEGGLFEFIWCPHYIGEIMAFVGLAIVTQNILAFPFQIASALYLALRALSTKAWYENRYPAAVSRAALIPGVV